MAIRVFRYRLYPTEAQHTKMQSTLDACRWVYNKALETRKEAWDSRKESVSTYDTINMLPGWKNEYPWLRQAHSQVLQDVCNRVGLAFEGFFRRVKADKNPGYPRFKGKGRYKSFTYTQSGYKLHSNDSILWLSKIDRVKINLHRPIEGQVKRLVVKQTPLGKWFACFVIEFVPISLPLCENAVGIDLGCKRFMTLSTGEWIGNPRFFRRDEVSLAKAQRRLAVCKRGSKEYAKRKRVVQHIHERIGNRRKDFLHKLSRMIVDNFQVIVFEDLSISGMQKGNWRSLNKSISDASWGQLVKLTKEKAEWAARTVITVDPRNTSQTCSYCGIPVPKDLSTRIHQCPHCEVEVDRDYNAARNILTLGLQCMGIPIPKNLQSRKGMNEIPILARGAVTTIFTSDDANLEGGQL